MILPEAIMGGAIMGKIKRDPSTIGLDSAQVEGQGTTQTETGNKTVSSSRKSKKRG